MKKKAFAQAGHAGTGRREYILCLSQMFCSMFRVTAAKGPCHPVVTLVFYTSGKNHTEGHPPPYLALGSSNSRMCRCVHAICMLNTIHCFHLKYHRIVLLCPVKIPVLPESKLKSIFLMPEKICNGHLACFPKTLACNRF